jgi:hypothetical protein
MEKEEPSVTTEISQALKKGHSGTSLVLAAILEDYLERALRIKLSRLSGKMAERWFGAFGPLGNLASKIEFAFVLELINDAERKDADTVRRIRNKFAHSTDFLFFESLEVIELCKKLGTYGGDESKTETVYMMAVANIATSLKVKYDAILEGREVLEKLSGTSRRSRKKTE